jgi:hypothetical protein
MREILLMISERYSANKEVTRKILSLAFERELELLDGLVSKVFPNNEFQSSLLKQEEFLVNLEAIAESISSFSQAVSSISFPEWNSPLWTTISSKEELFNYFPVAVLWERMLVILANLLILINSHWEIQHFFVVFQSSTNNRSLLEEMYGPSVHDIKKYLGGKEESSLTNIITYRFKEVFRNLVSVIYKTFALAMKQKIFYFLIPEGFLEKTLNCLPYLETVHFIMFIRYFVVSFLINSLAVRRLMVLSFCQEFLSIAINRLRVSAISANTSIPSNLAKIGDDEYKFLIYHEHLIFSIPFSGLGNDVITAMKENIVVDFFRAFSEVFGSVFGLRGPLAFVAQQTATYSEVDNVSRAANLARRYQLISSLLSSPGFEFLAFEFIQALAALLTVGDSVACKESLSCFTWLTYLSLRETKYIPIIAGEIFNCLLAILLRSVRINAVA